MARWKGTPGTPDLVPDSLQNIVSTLDSFLSSIPDIGRIPINPLLLPDIDVGLAIINGALLALDRLVQSYAELQTGDGVWVSGDWEDLEWPLNGLTGGYSSYQARMVTRLRNTTDPNYPNLPSGSPCTAVFFYSSAGEGGAELTQALDSLSEIAGLFKAPSRIGLAYPRVSQPTIRYSDGAYRFVSASRLRRSIVDIRVDWQASDSQVITYPGGYDVLICSLPELPEIWHKQNGEYYPVLDGDGNVCRLNTTEYPSTDALYAKVSRDSYVPFNELPGSVLTSKRAPFNRITLSPGDLPLHVVVTPDGEVTTSTTRQANVFVQASGSRYAITGFDGRSILKTGSCGVTSWPAAIHFNDGNQSEFSKVLKTALLVLLLSEQHTQSTILRAINNFVLNGGNNDVAPLVFTGSTNQYRRRMLRLIDSYIQENWSSRGAHSSVDSDIHTIKWSDLWPEGPDTTILDSFNEVTWSGPSPNAFAPFPKNTEALVHRALVASRLRHGHAVTDTEPVLWSTENDRMTSLFLNGSCINIKHVLTPEVIAEAERIVAATIPVGGGSSDWYGFGFNAAVPAFDMIYARLRASIDGLISRFTSFESLSLSFSIAPPNVDLQQIIDKLDEISRLFEAIEAIKIPSCSVLVVTSNNGMEGLVREFLNATDKPSETSAVSLGAVLVMGPYSGAASNFIAGLLD